MYQACSNMVWGLQYQACANMVWWLLYCTKMREETLPKCTVLRSTKNIGLVYQNCMWVIYQIRIELLYRIAKGVYTKPVWSRLAASRPIVDAIEKIAPGIRKACSAVWYFNSEGKPCDINILCILKWTLRTFFWGCLWTVISIEASETWWLPWLKVTGGHEK